MPSASSARQALVFFSAEPVTAAAIARPPLSGQPPPARAGSGFGRFAERKEERRPLIRLGLGPEPPPMVPHHQVHDREPDAGTFKLPGAVEALEGLTQAGRVRHVEAHAVVAQ